MLKWKRVRAGLYTASTDGPVQSQKDLTVRREPFVLPWVVYLDSIRVAGGTSLASAKEYAQEWVDRYAKRAEVSRG